MPSEICERDEQLSCGKPAAVRLAAGISPDLHKQIKKLALIEGRYLLKRICWEAVIGDAIR